MAIASPVSDKYTTVALLILTFATGLVDAVSVLVLGVDSRLAPWHRGA